MTTTGLAAGQKPSLYYYSCSSIARHSRDQNIFSLRIWTYYIFLWSSLRAEYEYVGLGRLHGNHKKIFFRCSRIGYPSARPNEKFIFSEHRHIIYFCDPLNELSKNISVLDVSIATTKFFPRCSSIGYLISRPNEKLFSQNMDILYIFELLSTSWVRIYQSWTSP